MKVHDLTRQNWLGVLVTVFIMGLLTSCIHVDCNDCEGKDKVADPTVESEWSCRDDPGYPGPGDQCWGTSFDPPGGYYHKKGCENDPLKWCENVGSGSSQDCECVPF